MAESLVKDRYKNESKLVQPQELSVLSFIQALHPVIWIYKKMYYCYVLSHQYPISVSPLCDLCLKASSVCSVCIFLYTVYMYLLCGEYGWVVQYFHCRPYLTLGMNKTTYQPVSVWYICANIVVSTKTVASIMKYIESDIFERRQNYIYTVYTVYILSQFD